jgi:putative transcriptional regulator
MLKRNAVPIAFAVLLACFAGLAQAGEHSQAQILVAKPALGADPVFGSTILVAIPIGGDQHAGFIVNRPTSVTLGSVFPGNGPSQKVVDPIYLGGPVDSDEIFALVQGSESPGKGSIELLPGIFAAISGNTVDRVIASDPEDARFLAGLVVWKPGELQDEIKQGLWYVLEPDPALVLPRRTEGLWEELARRSKIAADAI